MEFFLTVWSGTVFMLFLYAQFSYMQDRKNPLVHPSDDDGYPMLQDE